MFCHVQVYCYVLALLHDKTVAKPLHTTCHKKKIKIQWIMLINILLLNDVNETFNSEIYYKESFWYLEISYKL